MHWSIGSENKKLYLTFDDGPHEIITPQILQLLDAYNAKATFFCLGKNVERNPEIFAQILQKGHAVGNHTYSHLNGWKVKNKAYFDDINRCNAVFQSQLFRPPYGKISPWQIFKLSRTYKIIMWSVLSYDFDQRLTADSIFKQLIKHTKDGAILVFHDSMKASQNCLSVLPRILAYYKGEGFHFESLDAIFSPEKKA